MDAEFICREIDDRKGEGLAIGYELHTIQIFGSISKTTWEAQPHRPRPIRFSLAWNSQSIATTQSRAGSFCVRGRIIYLS